MVTPKRQDYVKRRQSHPLNFIRKRPYNDYSKSAPTNTQDYLNSYNLSDNNKILTSYNNTSPLIVNTNDEISNRNSSSPSDVTDVVDTRKPNSTLKSLLAMQIEYSPGPFTATQSLVALRRRLTKTLTQAKQEKTPMLIENSLYNTLNQSEKCSNNGITISCDEQSPTLEGSMEEKSILEQISNKYDFVNNLKKENSKLENTLVSSLSQRLEWLRLNNNLNNVNKIKKNETEINCFGENPRKTNKRNDGDDGDEVSNERRKREWDMIKMEKYVKKKMRKCACDGACDTGYGSCCDKNKPKTHTKPTLMGLTLPSGIC